MIFKSYFYSTCLGLILFSAATAANAQGRATARADVINNRAQPVGTITLTQAPEGVLLYADLRSLPPGKHGFHIHRVGDCSDNRQFKDAGGHIGKDDAKHGLLNPDGYEAGDLPNLIVSENGTVEVEMFADGLALADGPNAILDDDGAAFMIHADPDDHMTQPIGGAGDRIACGVIQG